MNKLIHIFLIALSIPILAACTPADSGPRATLGSSNAPVLIEEFSDFECPACGRLAPEIEELVKKNPNIARLEFHHFPLPYHENAFRAAEASECANDQGKFWEYSKLLFKNQTRLTEDNLKSFAGQVNLEQGAFDTCFDGNKKRTKIKSDIADGTGRQLSYTPSLYVNGKLVPWSNAEDFEKYIKSL
ncbi:DsbA family protein [candidate division KSB1 bacterium]